MMHSPVTLIFAFLFLCMVVGTLYGFYWAAKTGQLDEIQEGAKAIFDGEEQVGVITDAFPDRQGLPKKGVTLVKSLERKYI